MSEPTTTTIPDGPFNWAQRNRWNLPDTDWARTAMAIFARVDTGPHNIWGDFAGRISEIEAATDDMIVSRLRARRPPVEVSQHHAVMFCTNTIGPRLARTLVEAVDNGWISDFEIRPTLALSRGEIDFAFDHPDPVMRDDWDRIMQVVVDDPDGECGEAFFQRIFTEVIVWPPRSTPSPVTPEE